MTDEKWPVGGGRHFCHMTMHQCRRAAAAGDARIRQIVEELEKEGAERKKMERLAKRQVSPNRQIHGIVIHLGHHADDRNA